ncbi:VOC family protein [Actinoplanes teichomyceticus]|uniref:Glyoxalase-like domain-containing protein n=1 Tax=Actinoplanes teichomyceticus TaxID=1867 RepID=A0A561VMI2_ACTTI|nr:VOC family protein [Actinoplanes teichomyceticus]TWG12829.1 hypothetical protein FHX34_105697 [Actinoplanes teichomyceticus]GIF13575.1 hypothetical protein Ate01nite_36070 [Actinoplanes teichomyceticus]
MASPVSAVAAGGRDPVPDSAAEPHHRRRLPSPGLRDLAGHLAPDAAPRVSANGYGDPEPHRRQRLSQVERLVSLGATRLRVDEHGVVVLADPDGNEFGVLPP